MSPAQLHSVNRDFCLESYEPFCCGRAENVSEDLGYFYCKVRGNLTCHANSPVAWIGVENLLLCLDETDTSALKLEDAVCVYDLQKLV